jgi:hypothetical protein
MNDVFETQAKCCLLVLVFGLITASSVQAGDLVIPDRARLQTISQEEYAGYRRQIQNSIDGMGATERNLAHEPAPVGNRDVGYGQGYAFRHAQGGRGRGGGRSR